MDEDAEDFAADMEMNLELGENGRLMAAFNRNLERIDNFEELRAIHEAVQDDDFLEELVNRLPRPRVPLDFPAGILAVDEIDNRPMFMFPEIDDGPIVDVVADPDVFDCQKNELIPILASTALRPSYVTLSEFDVRLQNETRAGRAADEVASDVWYEDIMNGEAFITAHQHPTEIYIVKKAPGAKVKKVFYTIKCCRLATGGDSRLATFFAPFARHSSLLRLYVSAVSVQGSTLRLAAHIADKKVFNTLMEAFSPAGMDFVAHGHVLVSLLRLCGHIEDTDNAFCQVHDHDGEMCERQERLNHKRYTDDFERFFDLAHHIRQKPPHYRLSTEAITARLRPYQRDAVRFMMHRECKPDIDPGDMFRMQDIVSSTHGNLCFFPNLGILTHTIVKQELPSISTRGGILADEMGLGKTVELLALITSLTPETATPLVVDEEGEEDEKMNDVFAVVNDLVSQVVAIVDGEKGMEALTKMAADRDALYFTTVDSHGKQLPFLSPTKVGRTISCASCGSSCLERRVHWSPGLSAHQEFVCPQCVSNQKEPIPLRATLIVTPTQIAQQWYEEIRKHVKDDVKIDVYRGVAVEGYKHPHYLAKFDIVLTTYDVVARENNFENPNERFMGLRKRKYERPMMSTTPLFSVNWWRIVLDESQMVESATSSIARMCCKLQARARWCVTGTPMTRSIEDLHGLISFLDVFPMGFPQLFQRALYKPYATGANKTPLVNFFSQFFWRTAKKRLWAVQKEKVEHKLELVNLSPLEERMYTDLLKTKRHYVTQWLHGMDPSTRMCDLTRTTISKLNDYLSDIRKFLLIAGYKKKKDSAEPGKTFKSYSPEALQRQLLKTKINDVVSAIRDRILHFNGAAGAFWLGKHFKKAMASYKLALDAAKSTIELNKLLGKPAQIAYSSRETNAMDDDDNEPQKMSQQLNAVTVDSMQLNHIYRNLEWLIVTCDGDPGTSAEMMEGVVEEATTLRSQLREEYDRAWNCFTRRERANLAGHYYSWNELMQADIDPEAADAWLDTVINAANTIMDGDVFQRFHAELNIPRKFRSWNEVAKWMRASFAIVKERAGTLAEKVQKCFEVLSVSDRTAESVSEKVWRDSDPVVEKNDRSSPSLPLQYPDDRQILGRNAKELFQNVVQCNKQMNMDSGSRLNCILCSTQSAANSIWRDTMSKNNVAQFKRPTMLRSIESALRTHLRRAKVLSEDDKPLWDAFTACVKHYDEMATGAEKLLITCTEFVNRIRELRQATSRITETDEKILELVDFDTSLEEKCHIVGEEFTANAQAVQGRFDKAVASLRYVKSLIVDDADDDAEAKQSAERECPICLDDVGVSWFVFPCAHLACSKCFLQLTKRVNHLMTGSSLSCSTCRAIFPRHTALFVDNRVLDKSAEKGMEHLVGLQLPSKFEAIVKRIFRILLADPNEKILVFTSQLTGQSALEDVFKRAKVPFVTLTSNDRKHHQLASFRNHHSIRVLLMCYKSGGKGLNLTMANHIIFADPIDDGSLEKQVIGRCDRIGQTRDVHVYHFVVRDTAEERIYRMCRAQVDSGREPVKQEHWTLRMFYDLFKDRVEDE